MPSKAEIRELNTYKSQLKDLESLNPVDWDFPGLDYIFESAGLKERPRVVMTSKDIGREGEFYTSLNTILVSEGHQARLWGREGAWAWTLNNDAKETKERAMIGTVFHESEHVRQIQFKEMTGVSKSGLYFNNKFMKWKDIFSKEGKEYAELPHEKEAVARERNMPSIEEWKKIQRRELLEKKRAERVESKAVQTPMTENTAIKSTSRKGRLAKQALLETENSRVIQGLTEGVVGKVARVIR